MKKLGFVFAVCCLMALACEAQEDGAAAPDRFVAAPGEASAQFEIDSQAIYEKQLNWLKEMGGKGDKLRLESFAGEFMRVVMPELKKFSDNFIKMDVLFADGNTVFNGWQKDGSSELICRFLGKKGDHFNVGIYYAEGHVKLAYLRLDNFLSYDYGRDFVAYSMEEVARIRMLGVICLEQAASYVKQHDAEGQESVLTKLNENF